MNIRSSFKHTIAASYIGYITQAIVNNFAPLLFLTFHNSYGISLEKIGLLVTVNFGVQLLVDLISAKYIDRIGYRRAIVAAHIFAAAGLIGLSFLPDLFSDPYPGLCMAIVLYAIGGGLIEVLISPIVEACPTDGKSAAMSLLHSFYCWGSVLVVLISTLLFAVFGTGSWKVISCFWAIVPLFNAFYFTQVPINSLSEGHETMGLRKLLTAPMFWVLALLMVCSGASELAMSQWASAFAESGLNVSKTVGDIAGPCFFAVLMGSSRVFHAKFTDRLNLSRYMGFCAILCIASYLLASLSPIPVLSLLGCGICGFSVGVMWPGTFSLASEKCPAGGTAMFALLALAGDTGCSLGPTIVGFVSGALNDNLKAGLLCAIVFPLLMLVGLWLCVQVIRTQKQK
ncbi:MAG: MFS transporter [Lachnospiraceae bacterium]|nr:MFS transporter [Lachnospiraceae bacterium]